MKVSPARALRSILLLACSCVGLGLVMIGMHVPFMFFLIAAGVVWNRVRRVAASGWSHGTARFASMGDLIRWNMLGHDGLILGTTRIMPRPTFREGLSALWSAGTPADMACHLFFLALGGSRWVADRMIRLTHFTHLATFAPTGRGKGVSVIIPNLLSYFYSCVVTDPKGENFIKTAWVRFHKLKNRIIRLDPFGICGPGSDTLNPLDAIDDEADDFLDQCRDLADMLIVQSGKEPDPYWNDSARSVLTAFIAFVCACEDKPEKRTLDTVRDLLSSRSSYAKAIEIMQQVESHGGVIQRLGHSLTWHVDRELGSVLSNVQRHTEPLDSPVIKRNMASSSFNPMWLRTGRVTIYLILPHDKLETLAPIMRVWIGVILRTITEGKPSERNPVLFLLDEAAHLGKIRVLENAVTLMRGMGIRLWFFFQSLHQVNDCFGEKAKTFLDNIDTQQYFSINEYENAEAISKRIGETTISVVSHGDNSGDSRQYGETGQRSSGVSSGRNTNYSDTGRRLLKPEELIVLPEDVALVFHRNLPVIPARLLTYYNHPAFRGGGTGTQPGLGQNAMQQAVALLVACIVFAAMAVSLSPFNPWPHRRPASIQPWPVSGWPDSAAEFGSPPFPDWQVSEWRFSEE
jgi:type IV secretion system protein VirD4